MRLLLRFNLDLCHPSVHTLARPSETSNRVSKDLEPVSGKEPQKAAPGKTFLPPETGPGFWTFQRRISVSAGREPSPTPVTRGQVGHISKIKKLCKIKLLPGGEGRTSNLRRLSQRIYSPPADLKSISFNINDLCRASVAVLYLTTTFLRGKCVDHFLLQSRSGNTKLPSIAAKK